MDQMPSQIPTQHTDFAPIANLACEHHFGNLDSSKKKEDQMLHHSTVQLLKRNRKSMMEWLGKMDNEIQIELFTSARQGGKRMSVNHMLSEKPVSREIHDNMCAEQLSEGTKCKTKSLIPKITRH